VVLEKAWFKLQQSNIWRQSKNWISSFSAVRHVVLMFLLNPFLWKKGKLSSP